MFGLTRFKTIDDQCARVARRKVKRCQVINYVNLKGAKSQCG